MRTVGFQGEIVCDVTQPDGTPRKLLSVERLQTLGWQAKTSLSEGIRKTYASFLEGSSRL
jgi:GDP-L-fucose synthase